MRARIQLTIQTADNGKRCGRKCPYSHYNSAGSRICKMFGYMAEDHIGGWVRSLLCIKAEAAALKGKKPQAPEAPPKPKPTAWDRLGKDDETIEDPG